MANTRDIKKRIKSISSTKKITRAMEMVSAAKMRRAIEAVLKTRAYANLSWSTVLSLAQGKKDGQALHPLLTRRGLIKKTAVVLITSNRGLCGGFNATIIKKVLETAKGKERDNFEFILLGKRGVAIHKNFGFAVAADFPKQDYINEVREVTAAAKLLINDYLSGRYDQVLAAYTDFVNAVKQEPRLKQLLPIEIKKQDEHLGNLEGAGGAEQNLSGQAEYIFEPSPAEVLDQMLPRLIEIQLYQAILESNASEQSARRLAMHQATEAATDMVSELTLSYNKARQAAVTKEIAEISAGANALAE
ncbi:MAG: ATP synthase F1 subunit gamma [Patescibacteria group bacterium]|nr:ATP synthase F1 subunit gamma [Patescibacteria group bacterium]